MAATNIGSNKYPLAKMPALADPADIQVALKYYHWGQEAEPEGTATAGIAKYLDELQSDITDINTSLDGVVLESIIDAKGDLIVGTGNDAVDNLSVGSDGYFLKSNSSQTLGMEWSALPAASTTGSGIVQLSDSTSTTSSILAATPTAIKTTYDYADTHITASTSVHGISGSVVGTTDTQTLTNKTLTSPTINNPTFTGQVSGLELSATQAIIFEGTTADNFETTLTAGEPTADRTITLPDATTTLVGTDSTQTLTSKTITQGVLIAPEERLNISATAATGTVNINVNTSPVWYYTTNATGNFVINIRGDGSTTLNSLLTIGDSITIVFLNTNGSTAYYNTSLQIDGTGTGVTTKWQGGSAPSAGNASSIDVYAYNVIKTANAVFTVLASQTKFA